MKEIKNDADQIKTVLVNVDEGFQHTELKNLSLTLNAKVYLIPKKTEVELNDNGWLISSSGDKEGIWQFILGWAMPYSCFINGFPFPLRIEEVWKSSNPVERVNVSELEWNLTYPWWNKYPESYYDLKPESVIENPGAFKDHEKRVNNADVGYPLTLLKTKQDRWLVYDGMHRFVKLVTEVKDQILCQKFLNSEVGGYVPDPHKSLFEEWLRVKYE